LSQGWIEDLSDAFTSRYYGFLGCEGSAVDSNLGTLRSPSRRS